MSDIWSENVGEAESPLGERIDEDWSAAWLAESPFATELGAGPSEECPSATEELTWNEEALAAGRAAAMSTGCWRCTQHRTTPPGGGPITAEAGQEAEDIAQAWAADEREDQASRVRRRGPDGDVLATLAQPDNAAVLLDLVISSAALLRTVVGGMAPPRAAHEPGATEAEADLYGGLGSWAERDSSGPTDEGFGNG